MLEIKFLNNDIKYQITLFKQVNEHVISIDLVTDNNNGFVAYNDGVQVGDFSNYTTIYKKENNLTLFSNDGSTYVEPTKDVIVGAKFIGGSREKPDEIRIVTNIDSFIASKGNGYCRNYNIPMSADVEILEADDITGFTKQIDTRFVTYNSNLPTPEEKSIILGEMLSITREPSDKLGYDWEIYKLGDVEIRREYVENGSHQGTEDNPFTFELGIELIPNAFYLYEEEKWVWMGSRIIATEYPSEDDFSWAKWTI